MALVAFATTVSAADWNPTILAAVERMPSAGGYSTSHAATECLQNAVRVERGNLALNLGAARPSYCSGATYLVFLRVVAAAQKAHRLNLTEGQLEALLPAGQRDGEGVWGRWNANGPGTARLFHELGLGSNFTSFDDARPGDFMKIFWRDAVGSDERGHLVVYLGREMRDGEDYVMFWSSNQPDGFGRKSVKRSEIARVLFSRLEHLEQLGSISTMDSVDEYLASLLEKRSSFEEACRLSGAR